jgi:hypothetical protein
MGRKYILSQLSLIIIAILLMFSSACKKAPDEYASSDKYRLVWNTDPTSSITLAWDQWQNSDVEVYFGTIDWGRKYWKYRQKVAPAESNNKYEMNTQFAWLNNLKAGTNYYFVVKDEFGVSKRYWFKTAPSKPSPIFIYSWGRYQK